MKFHSNYSENFACVGPMQKHSNHLLGGGAYVTFVLVRSCVYIQICSSSREFVF